MTETALPATSRLPSVVAGLLFLSLYAFSTLLSKVSETCTMGGTDGFVAGLIVGVPLAALAAGLLWRARNAEGWARTLRLAAFLPGLGLLVLAVPWALSTTLLGHHACGPQFDPYLEYSRFPDRWVPAAHVLLAVVILRIATLRKAVPGHAV